MNLGQGTEEIRLADVRTGLRQFLQCRLVRRGVVVGPGEIHARRRLEDHAVLVAQANDFVHQAPHFVAIAWPHIRPSPHDRARGEAERLPRVLGQA